MNTTLTIDMTHLPNSIPLGRCGENHTVIRFDCTSYLETYGEGSAALLFQPAQGSMHPVVVEQTGALVTWRVSASETAQSIADGMGAVYVKQSGGKLSGNLDAQSHTISNLQAPAAGRDAATKQYVDDARAACLSADALQTAVLDMFYPVGTLYHTTASAFDPAAAWGGTWERIKDRFLLAAGTAYAGGSTGGEATHKLTAQEMPSHTHTMYVNNDGSSSSWSPTAGEYLIKPDGVTTSKKNYQGKLAQNGAGLDQAHNNMPPYLAVYIWKRTA